MAIGNINNLIKNEDLTPEERRANARKAGIASGIARREKRDRQQRIRELLDLSIQNEKMIKNLANLGIDASNMTIETAMDARQALKAMNEGDTNAYKALKNEAYGPMIEKQEIDLSAEVKSININIKKFDN